MCYWAATGFMQIGAFLPHCINVMQWIGDKVEVVPADEAACVAIADSEVDVEGGKMSCVTGRDLTEYDYVSVGKDGFIPISAKPTNNVTRLANGMRKRTEEYRSSKNDIKEIVDDFYKVGKLGRGFAAIDELEEIDIGGEGVPRPTYVSAKLTDQ
jgi:hypothetical protein